MSNKEKAPTEQYNAFTTWLNEFKSHELTDLVMLVDKAKQYIVAAETIPQEKVTQFIDNFTYDLTQFYQQTQSEIKHSTYLDIVNENFWQQLAQITDKSQVEWSELVDDFSHSGEYHSGDVVGFGELECCRCHHKVTFTHLAEVSDCIECGGETYVRKGLEP